METPEAGEFKKLSVVERADIIDLMNNSLVRRPLTTDRLPPTADHRPLTTDR